MSILNALQGSTSSSYGYNTGHSASSTMGTGAITNEQSISAAAQANAWAAQQAQEQRAWQERMANTAYQRTVKDLKKAGLNPILAYTNGATSVGSGASAGAYMPSFRTDSESYSESYGEQSSHSAMNLTEGITALAKGLEQAFSALGVKELADSITGLVTGNGNTHPNGSPKPADSVWRNATIKDMLFGKSPVPFQQTATVSGHTYYRNYNEKTGLYTYYNEKGKIIGKSKDNLFK